jgi:hypothetical protein
MSGTTPRTFRKVRAIFFKENAALESQVFINRAVCAPDAAVRNA